MVVKSGAFFFDLLAIVFLFVVAVRRLEESKHVPLKPSSDDWSRMIDVIRLHGSNPMIRFTRFDNDLFIFASNGILIVYKLVGNTAFALGDPIGEIVNVLKGIMEFSNYCKVNGWIPVFYQAQPNYLQIYHAAGFGSLCIGHDALLDLSTFDLGKPSRKNVRNSYNKLVRLGYQTQICHPPHSSLLLDELNLISSIWISNQGGFEIGFSLGRFRQEYLNTSQIILARDSIGKTAAFANLVSDSTETMLSIDLMRYNVGAPNGLMDFLFVSAIQWAKNNNFTILNLGFAPFSNIDEKSNSSQVEKLIRKVHSHPMNFREFKGLEFFKNKFNSIWSPRYLIYPGILSLPFVMINIMRSYEMGRIIADRLSRRYKLIKPLIKGE